MFSAGPYIRSHTFVVASFSSVKAITPYSSCPHHGNIDVSSDRVERLMWYYRDRMEWETSFFFFKVKMSYYELCSEMEKNLKPNEQKSSSIHAVKVGKNVLYLNHFKC